MDALVNEIFKGTISLDAKNTVSENWNAMPIGSSICRLIQGDVRYAYVGKVSDLFGTILIFGYHPDVAKPIYGQFNNGIWTWTNIATTTQPNWITATLLNGWTGTIQYRKDDFGRVAIRGILMNIGTTCAGTVICQLPEGYNTLAWSVLISVVKGNIVPYDTEFYFVVTSEAKIKVANGVTLPPSGTIDATLLFDVEYSAT